MEITCLPTDIPERVNVDVTALKIGDSIHVSDLSLPGVDILSDLAQTITSVIPPMKEEEVAKPVAAEGVPAEAVVAEGAEPAEPEVISEKKAEERAAEREKTKAEKEKEEGKAPPAKGPAPKGEKK